MGLAFWISPLLFGKNLLRSLLGDQIQVSAKVWHRLNFAWVAFFALMGLLNLWVAYTFATSVWVNFKLFGGIGLMLVFVMAQGVYLGRHMNVDAPAADPEAGKQEIPNPPSREA
jgi:intracellular septation protein